MDKRPVILTSKSNFYGVKLVEMFPFQNGTVVPVYEVSTVSGLNQLIGFAKFVNRDYGEVYYRGVNKIFNTLLPSLMRNRKSGVPRDLTSLVNNLYDNEQFRNTLKLSAPKRKIGKTPEQKVEINTINRNNKYIIEGVLQHYSGATRFLDLVDNHWVALWMGLYEYEELGSGNSYSRYKKRIIPQVDYLERMAYSFRRDNALSAEEISDALRVDKDEIDKYYMYILLIATPNDMLEKKPGSYENNDFAMVDLRKALPSFFIRPHAQHAYVFRARDKQMAQEYDLSSQVVGIIRIRVDKADEWLGNGTLLTQSNLFPPPAVDMGYHSLLEYYNEFDKTFKIKNYLSDIR